MILLKKELNLNNLKLVTTMIYKLKFIILEQKYLNYFEI